MRDLVAGFIAGRLDRRGFMKGMTAAGFSLAAAESVLAALAPMAMAQKPPPAACVVEGTGAFFCSSNSRPPASNMFSTATARPRRRCSTPWSATTTSI